MHLDRGSQYISHAFQDALAEHGMRGPMNCAGHCWDDASIESWLNSFQNRRIPGERFSSHEAVKGSAFDR
ncbi:DDE-type integrase/transposase/recombinase [Thiorhodococcus minor]|uniref:DDE-type integrase/transposase/recombinase n=1 Tax=Thiorhodococcus minor TaxID=57489 RepID=A0A6M0K2U0_9GAMM|nr:DDE-type integrase/transposase/recombinase [Thiorhodococcus minor]NEV64086.1 DDE-type integrase/transposase/recombinase [Thiorhodococcus minor]